MNWNRLLAMACKEVIQIKRDARSIAIVIAMPLVMMLAFGYGVSFDTKHIPVYVFDMEGSQQSQDFLKRFPIWLMGISLQVCMGTFLAWVKVFLFFHLR